MKVTVIGFDSAEDTSKKTGNEYSIGNIYASIKLDGRNVEGKFISKGSMGTEYRVEPSIVKKIAHLPLPFEAELHIEDVMRYGKRESKVIDCVPVARVASGTGAGGLVRAA